jgi:aminomethyltransferase
MSLKTTPLHAEHQRLQAKLVEFGGWDMPLHYGSQLEEHQIVRRDAGMFDVSHMTCIDLHGEKVGEFLKKLLANDIEKLKVPGKALYSCMLNENGGVIDDLICYFQTPTWYRLVVNASTREKDVAWITKQAQPFNVKVEMRDDVALIAIQGPNARNKVHSILSESQKQIAEALKPFFAQQAGDLFIARTGYTGEDGYEIMLPTQNAVHFWQELLKAGVQPIGLGARDTLRLEAGLNLYGNDMDETVSPLESNLTWTVAFSANRDFIGKGALEKQQQAGIAYQLVGLVIEDRGVIRHHAKVAMEEGGEGYVTSGTFSPTLGKAIAMARIPVSPAHECLVELRGKPVKARIVALPFVRQGKILV